MCGLTHLVMPLSPYNEKLREVFLFICCGVSLLTAIVITLVLPLIIKITDKLELTEEGVLLSIQSKLVEVIECCQESIVVMSLDWYIISSNISTNKIFGSNLESCCFLTLIHDDDKAKFTNGVALLLEKSKCFQEALLLEKSKCFQETTFSAVDVAEQTDYFSSKSQDIEFGHTQFLSKADESKKTLVIEYRASNQKGGWTWVESTFFISAKPKKRHPQPKKSLWSTVTGSCRRAPILPDDVAISFKECGSRDKDDCQIMMLSRNVTDKKQKEFIREQKQKQREIENVNSAKLRYITSCAHDLKTPLQSFNFAIELLANSSLEPDQMDILNQARVSALLMSLTISQTMDTSKVLIGQELVPRKVTVFLSDIFSRVGIIIESYSRQVPIIFHLGAGIRNRVITDEEWLWQMILNYLTNACKFTERGSVEVRLNLESQLADNSFLLDKDESVAMVSSSSASASASVTSRLARIAEDREVSTDTNDVDTPEAAGKRDFLVFRIVDSGVGVSDKQKPTLFNIYSQAQSGQATGTGVGLYGIKIRSEGLGGNCGMVSRQLPDNGSVFWFKIPYAPDTSSYGDSTPESRDNLTDEANFKNCRVFKNISDQQENPESVLRLEIPCLRTDIGSSIASWESMTSIAFNRALSIAAPNEKSNVDGATQEDPLAVAIRERGLSAFVVDDVLSIRKLMRRTLQNMGFVSIKLFENGSAALEAMKTEKVDVVFMDIQMPIMSGPEV
jgi:signal transduction histidine kinase